MDLSYIDVISLPWSFENFVSIVKNDPSPDNDPNDTNISLEPKFSEKPSRPMITIIDTDLYKKLISKRLELTKYAKYSKLIKLINPYEKVEKGLKILKNEMTKQDVIIHEIITFVNTYSKTFLSFPKIEKPFTYTDEFSPLMDKENEEQYNVKIIFNGVIKAIENKSNSFICKIFDTHTSPTYQIINLLCIFYSNVLIIKPRTVSYFSNEKYIVCVGFLQNNKINNLEKLEELTNNDSKNLPFCRDFGISDNKIQKIIQEHNCKISKIQIKYIEALINSEYLLDNQISILESYQMKLANNFCKIFGLYSKYTETNKCLKGHKFCKTEKSNVYLCEECHKLFTYSEQEQ
jgi:hypothetical protein